MFNTPFTSEQLFIGAAAFIFLMLCSVVVLAKKNHAHPYEILSSILTPPEQQFYKVLSSTLQGRAIVMAKVRIADLIKVRRTISRKTFWRHFSKISQKHIDFVLVDPQSFASLCVIELDDKSHARPDRILRDRFVNQVMAQTDIPLYRFPVRRRYDRAKLLQILSPCLSQ